MPRAKLKTQGEYFMFARNVCGAIAAFTLLLSAPVYGQALKRPSPPMVDKCVDGWEISDAYRDCNGYGKTTIQVTSDAECRISARCRWTVGQQTFDFPMTATVAFYDVPDLDFCIDPQSGGKPVVGHLSTHECQSQEGDQTAAEVPIFSPASPDPGTLTAIEDPTK